jgi:hypothetical protein
MKRFFRILAKSTAVFFAVLFVLTALLSLVLVTLGSRLFNPNLYKSALKNQQVYDSLPVIIGDMLVASVTYDPCVANPLACEGLSPELSTCYLQELGVERYAALASGEAEPDEAERILIQDCLDQYGSRTEDASAEGGIPIYLKNLTADNWAAIIRGILPPGELQIMVEDTLEGVFAYLKGDAERVTISMQTVKDRLSGATGDEVLRELITSQQDCTDELLAIITGERSMDELVLCNPPALLLPLALSTTHIMLDEAITSIPDEAVILPPKGGDTGAGDAMLGVRWARLIMNLSPLLPLVFLGLVTLFGVRSRKGWLRWWGVPFTITGGIALVGSLKMILLWRYAWEKWVTPRFPAYLGEAVAPLAQGLTGFIVRDLALWIGLWGLILFLVGLAAWILARFIKERKNEEQTPAEPLPPAA